MTRLAIQKLGYSSNPWRLVDLDGEETWVGPEEVIVKTRFEHPTLGETVIDQAVSGQTKTECIESTLRVLATLIDEKRRGVS